MTNYTGIGSGNFLSSGIDDDVQEADVIKLMVEYSEEMEHLKQELIKHGIPFTERVVTNRTFPKAIQTFQPDVIISKESIKVLNWDGDDPMINE